MKKTLILVAGPPATGKSYLITKIREKIPHLFMISPDEMKELFADKFGFNNLAEKEELEQKVWQFYYDILQKYMWIGKDIIVTEYPFSDKQKNTLAKFAKCYQYQIITIRLVCDFEILWQRRHKRDLELTRHLSHLTTRYHDGDKLTDRTDADQQITQSEFKQRITERKYNQFSLGKLYEIDVTNYNTIDYDALIADIILYVQ
ncbi:zeta toxin family protein [Orbus sasakiae]|uniref:Zeta toxin family protein n=1 Tax=Orbus sasakiae TaxID=1078475 RepID=A0ABP9N1R1_9GAMM